MAVGIMLAVTFVLIATMTLLPATLGALGPKVQRSIPALRENANSTDPRSSLRGANCFTSTHGRSRWSPSASSSPWPYLSLGLKVAMPSIAVVPDDAPVRQGYELVQAQFGDGAPGALQIVVPSSDAAATAAAASSVDGISMVTPPTPSTDDSNYTLLQAFPAVDPSAEAMGTILGDLRAQLPESALVGGAPAENLDLQQALNDYLPLVIGIILALGFILLLVALQAPLIAILGTAVSFAVDRRSVRGCEADLPRRTRIVAARLHPSRFPRRLGAGVLLRDDLCHRHGLHRVPARHRERTLREDRGPEGCSGRRPRALRTRHLRRCGGHGRRVLHLRALRSAPHPRKWASSSASRCCSTPS